MKLKTIFLPTTAASLLWLCPDVSAAMLPEGGAVSLGSGSISQQGNTLTVNQHSDKLSTNWQSFDIGKNNSVIFAQPNNKSVALNRVTGGKASDIQGNLSANGRVFLINPAGVVFGKNSRVNVGALVASTQSLSDEDFNNNRLSFKGSSTGKVINEGHITTVNGETILIGQEVRNRGTISTPGGRAALISGGETTLSLDDEGLLKASVQESTLSTLVSNEGLIQANGGQVVLSSRGKNAVLDNVVNNSGVIEARSVSNRNGTITLDGGSTGIVNQQGRIEASASGAGKGGNIIVAGQRISLEDHSITQANGSEGGGSVTIGRERQETPAAQSVIVNKKAQVHADALENGNGGVIDIWGSEANRSVGILTTREAGTGRGGLIETSGHWLDVEGSTINAGQNGQWLLDPWNVTITNGATDSGGTFTNGTWEPDNTGSQISNTTINQALNQGQNVTVTTNGAGSEFGDITVNGAINKTSGTASTLSLFADRNIILNSNIISTNNALNMDFRANLTTPHSLISTSPSIVVGGGITLNSNVQLNSLGGDISLSGITQSTATALYPAGIYLAGIVDARSSATSGGDITLNGNIANATTAARNPAGIFIDGGRLTTAGDGAVNLTATGTATASGSRLIRLNNATFISGTGGININSNMSATAGDNRAIASIGAVNFTANGGNISINGTVNNTNNAAITLSQGATVNLRATGAGTLSLNGNATSGASGIQLNNIQATTDGGAITITGTSATGLGLQILGATPSNFTSGNGAITLTGNSANSAVNGVSILNSNFNTASPVTILGSGMSLTGEVNNNGSSGIAFNASGSGLFTNSGSLTNLSTADLSITTNTGRISSGNISTNGNYSINSSTDLVQLGLSNIAGITSFTLPAATTLLATNAANIFSGAINLNAPLAAATINAASGLLFNASTASGLTLSNTGASHSILQTGALIASNLNAQTEGDVVLDNPGNQISSANITQAASINLNSASAAGALTLNGLVASDDILVTTTGLNGNNTPDIAVNGALTGNNITLAADTTRLRGDANGGRVYGGGAITPAERLTVYTSSVTGPTLTGYDFVSGSYRYNTQYADVPTAPDVGDALHYMMYRESPTLTVSTSDVSKVYNKGGDPLLPVILSGNANGDTAESIFSSTPLRREAGENVGSYAINYQQGLERLGYQVVAGAMGTLTITPLVIALDQLQARNKVYDSTTFANVTGSLTPVLPGDEVGLGTLSASFSDKNAGTGKRVTLNSVSLVGAQAANYQLASTNASLTADITPAQLSLSVGRADDKIYDGTLTATVNSALSGVLANDDVSLSGLSGTFSDKNVATDKPVTLNGGSLSGADSGNYRLQLPASVPGNITPALLSFTTTPDSKVYNGNTISEGTVSVEGLIADDSVSPLTQSFDSKNAGTRLLVVNSGWTINDGNGGGNYSVVMNNASGIITPADLILQASPDSKEYDGTTRSSGAVSFSGLVEGDSITHLTQEYDSSSPGARLLLVSEGYLIDDGAAGNNYRVERNTAAGTIVNKVIDVPVGGVSIVDNGSQGNGEPRYERVPLPLFTSLPADAVTSSYIRPVNTARYWHNAVELNDKRFRFCGAQNSGSVSTTDNFSCRKYISLIMNKIK